MDIRNVLMVISLGLSVIIGLLLARGNASQPNQTTTNNGSSTQPTTSGRPLIGLSLDTLKEPRWVSDRDLFIARCGDLGADVKVSAADSNDTQQAEDVQSLLSQHCQVLVIVPHDGLAMASSVAAANQQGVPVIAYDRIIRNCDLNLYVSFDNVNVGRQQAQFLVNALPNHKGRIVRIYGSSTDNNAKMFAQGQTEILQPYIDRGDITVVAEDSAEDWKPENATRIMEAVLANNKQFDAVLASNDGTAGGAIQALSAAGLAGKVIVTGQDADVAALQRIALGTQTMTIYKPVKELAKVAAESAVAIAQHQNIDAKDKVNNGKMDVPSILHSVITVTRDNIVQTVVHDGFHSYDEIYGSLPESVRPPRP